ncbi:hypothetical protein ACFW1F_02055 [Streptomyces bungoensis]|uniref:hypothetical protein n=1 Tax=Streptomyces bungoensis TaxID=285568 RepID=UPI003447C47A
MTPPVTLIRSDRSRTGRALATVGTGRHRGRRADEERCFPGGDLSGHGRHRRPARALAAPPTGATENRGDAEFPPLTTD